MYLCNNFAFYFNTKLKLRAINAFCKTKMPKNKKGLEYIAGIDVGSTKIAVLVARKEEDVVSLLGTSLVDSEGVKKGVVANIQSVLNAVEKAVIEAETLSNIRLQSALVGLSGVATKGLNSIGEVQIRYKVVNDHDVMSALQSAKAITLPANREIIYATPRIFTIDEKIKAHDPVGMHGDVLTAEVHSVISEKSSIKNVSQSVSQAGVAVEAVIPSIIAVSEAVLNDDEKKNGVCVIDMGGGTTDIAIYYEGVICHTEAITNSAHEVTTDIMHAFSINQEKAEEVKKQHGYAFSEMIEGEELIDIKHIGDDAIKKLSAHTLSEVIEARYEDIFDEVDQILQKSGYKHKISTLVLSGGGCRIKGCARLVERYFSKPARIGENSRIQSAENISYDPSYMVAMGLLLCTNPIIRIQNNLSFGVRIKNFFKMLVQ